MRGTKNEGDGINPFLVYSIFEMNIRGKIERF
jgi:hypothetical protein